MKQNSLKISETLEKDCLNAGMEHSSSACEERERQFFVWKILQS